MTTQEFVRRVEAYIRRHGMLVENGRVLVACSGGPDSMALVELMSVIQSRLGIELALAHLNHGLREQATDDEEFCRQAARQRGFRFFCERVDIGALSRKNRRGIEEQGRRSRYQFLSSVAKDHSFDRVALGHHRDDQAETLLLRLLRGAGSSGLAAAYPMLDGVFVRPFLATSRTEILGFLGNSGVLFVQDETNSELRFRRNRVRHVTLPRLAEAFNPGLSATLAQTADLLREENVFLDELTRKAFDELSLPGSNGVQLPISGLRKLPLALARRVVRQAISQSRGSLDNIKMVHVDDVLSLLEAAKSGKSLDLPAVGVRRDFDRLSFMPRTFRGSKWVENRETVYNGYEYALEIPARLLVAQTGDRLVAKPWEPGEAAPGRSTRGEPGWPKASGASVVVGTRRDSSRLTVRNPRRGDRFHPFGALGSKSVARYLMEQGVDKHRRRRIPLLVDDTGIIIWIAGYRISEQTRLGVPGTNLRPIHLQWKVK